LWPAPAGSRPDRQQAFRCRRPPERLSAWGPAGQDPPDLQPRRPAPRRGVAEAKSKLPAGSPKGSRRGEP